MEIEGGGMGVEKRSSEVKRVGACAIKGVHGCKNEGKEKIK